MRYAKLPQQQIVDMFNPVNIDFYAGLLGKAQENLDQATLMKSKYLEDVYNQRYIDKEARDMFVQKAEESVANALKADFVNPASVSKEVVKASKMLSPWRMANEKQLEEAKREQELRDRWGSNYIGNSVANMKLIDPQTGLLISPEKIKLIAGNREDLVQALARDNAGLADRVTEIPGEWKTILGGKAYEKKNIKIKGLTEEQRVNDFVKNTGLAKQYMEQMPGFAEAVRASGMNPEEYIAKEIDTWSKQLVKGQETESKYLDNPGWVDKSKSTTIVPGGGLQTYNSSLPSKINKTSSNISKIKAALSPAQAGGFNPSTGQIGRSQSIYTNPALEGYNPIGGVGEAPRAADNTKAWNTVQREFKEVSDKYGTIWKSIWKNHGFPTFKNPKEYTKAQNEFLDQVSLLEEYGLGTTTAYYQDNQDFDNTMATVVSNGLSMSKKEIGDVSSDIFEKGTSGFQVLPRNDGNITMIKNGTPYEIQVLDEDGNPTGVLDSRSTEIMKFQKQLYDKMFDFTDETYSNRLSLEQPVLLKTETGEKVPGIPYYSYKPTTVKGIDNKPIIINQLYVSYLDPATKTWHTIDDDGETSKPISLQEISLENMQILHSIHDKTK